MNFSEYFKYPAKISELKNRLYLYLQQKNVEVSGTDSLNTLIEKVKLIEGQTAYNQILITENGVYDIKD